MIIILVLTIILIFLRNHVSTLSNIEQQLFRTETLLAQKKLLIQQLITVSNGMNTPIVSQDSVLLTKTVVSDIILTPQIPSTQHKGVFIEKSSVYMLLPNHTININTPVSVHLEPTDSQLTT